VLYIYMGLNTYRMATVNGAMVSLASNLSADVAESVVDLVRQIRTAEDLDNFEALVEDTHGVAVIRQPRWRVSVGSWARGYTPA